jgi:prevent-host-death family protein
MPLVTTVSSRDFNQDTSGAKKAAARGPVFITDRGRPAHVLLSIEEYRRLTGGARRIADLLALPAEDANIEFEAQRLPDLPRPAELGEA